MKKYLFFFIALALITSNIWLYIAMHKQKEAMIQGIHNLAIMQAEADFCRKQPLYFITGTIPTKFPQKLEEVFAEINLKCTGSACLSSYIEKEYAFKYHERLKTWYEKKTLKSFSDNVNKAFQQAVGK